MAISGNGNTASSSLVLSWIPDGWYRHLLFAGIAFQLFFWVLFVAATVESRGVFSALGIDFGYFWAAAQAFRIDGPVSVYDLTVLERYAEPLLSYYGAADQQLRIGPVVYPPIFLIVMLPFTLFPTPLVAFIAWTLLNICIVSIVGRDIASRLHLNAVVVTTCLLLFFPITNSLFAGQPGGIMLLGVWKGITSLEDGRPIVAGVWFGLLLLKPNYLALLVLLFLITRKWNTIGGLALAGGAAVLSTVAILGARGSVTFVEAAIGLGLSVQQAVPSAAPDMMPTWRGILTHILSTDTTTGNLSLYATAALATAAAFAAILYLVTRIQPEHFVLAVFGTMLVTFLANPHTHIHALSLLAAPGVLLLARHETSQLMWRIYALMLFVLPVAGIASLMVTGWITWVAIALFAIQLLALFGVLRLLVREYRTCPHERELNHSMPASLVNG